MTRAVDSQEVRLGNFERVVGAIMMSLVVAIGTIIWFDHEAIGDLKTEVAVIKATLGRMEK